MSVNIKTLSGLVQVAGNTILLDGTCSEIQSGTITVPANTTDGNWSTTVTMPTAMTDTDYIIILNILPIDGVLYSSNANYRYKTTTSFIVHCVTQNVPLPQTIEWYAFRLVELEGYNAIYNKMTNIDVSPTENSTNLVTSGGVYDAISSASKIFVNSESAWNELDAETKATYQVAILTDKPNVNAVDSTDGSTTVVANKHLVFTGTLSEWEALTTTEKKTYDEALITNDMDTGEVVDAVTNGDMRAVTSNAVYDALPEYYSKTLTVTPTGQQAQLKFSTAQLTGQKVVCKDGKTRIFGKVYFGEVWGNTSADVGINRAWAIISGFPGTIKVLANRLPAGIWVGETGFYSAELASSTSIAPIVAMNGVSDNEGYLTPVDVIIEVNA